jgi:hypothetical protein
VNNNRIVELPHRKNQSTQRPATEVARLSMATIVGLLFHSNRRPPNEPPIKPTVYEACVNFRLNSRSDVRVINGNASLTDQ